MQGYGVKFAGEGNPMRGQNERAIAAVYQVVEASSVTCGPGDRDSQLPVLLPAKSPWAAR